MAIIISSIIEGLHKVLSKGSRKAQNSMILFFNKPLGAVQISRDHFGGRGQEGAKI